MEEKGSEIRQAGVISSFPRGKNKTDCGERGVLDDLDSSACEIRHSGWPKHEATWPWHEAGWLSAVGDKTGHRNIPAGQG